jgi:hypothetical protein
MALQSSLNENLFNIPAPEAYTIITEVFVEKRQVYSVSESSDSSPTLVTGHVITFKTNTYYNESSKNSQNPIANHIYTIPYNYESNSLSLSYLYGWLRNNIGMFINSVDV